MKGSPKLPEWNLNQLYPTSRHVLGELKPYEKKINEFASYRKALETRPTKELVGKLMELNERMAEKGHRIGTYSHLFFAQNTMNEEAKAIETNVNQFFTRMGNKTLFFGLWWKNLEDKTARKFLPKNKEHARALIEMRKYKKHLLSEKEEQLINLKDSTGENALIKIYDLLTNEFTFPWKKGKKTEMITEEELRSNVRDANPAIRIKAYDMIWNKFKEHNGKIGEIYTHIALDHWNEGVSLRKYKHPISVRNLSNDLPDELVENFLEVCRKNTSIFQGYMEWKMKTLRVPYSRYHVYAPLPHKEKKWTFNEGYSYVMDTYEQFSPHFKEQAHRVLKEKRLDVPTRKGKQGGAFCAGVSGKETAFVMLNWTNHLHDVTTLAHELGHAVHDHVSGHHSIFLQQAGLPLAETASTFGEMLVLERMLEENPNEEMQRHILAYQLDEAYASIQRQSFFSLFEVDAFNAIREGKSIPELNELYAQNLRLQFGKKMQLPAHTKYEWGMISHFFHSPFYVYAYAFGQLLVLALWEMYQKEGKDFIPRYLKFLSYGGSESPEKMLNEIGFDPNQKQSWRKGFTILEKKLALLKKT